MARPPGLIRGRRPAGVAALAGLAVATLVAIRLVGSADAQPPAAPAGALTLAAPLYEQLAALKGLARGLGPPPIELRTREQNRRFMEQELDRRYSPARLEADRKGLVAWALIPPDYDLRGLFLDLVQEQAVAYYDPRAKVMVLGDWLTPVEQHAALLHELVHALQDTMTPLDQFLTPSPGRGDHVLARQALIEGEAMGVMIETMLQTQGLDFAALPDTNSLGGVIAGSAGGPVIARAPRFLRELLLFPYVEGLSFVHAFRKLRPWAAIGELYRDPPRSSAQILHPEQRLGGNRLDPIAVALPDLVELAPGLREAANDEMGEFALGAVLAQEVGVGAGRQAAVGWRGDRYRIWEDDAGRLPLVYLVIMDSDAGATRLAGTFTRLVERRHPALRRRGIPGPVSLTTWEDSGRSFAVEKRGAEVLVVENLPSSAAAGARDAIWRSRGALAPATRP